MLHRRGTVVSTMIEARDLPIGDAVLADFQTGGRGRLDRSWEAPARSGLFLTAVLPLDPLVVFRAGVASAIAAGAQVRLKWPNDLVVRGRKLGGILAQARPPDRALVGIGINLSWAPPGAARLNRDREELLMALLPELEAWSAAPPGEVIERWRQLSETLGQQVRVEVGTEVITGVAEAISDDGALVVGGRRIVAGDVTRLRPT